MWRYISLLSIDMLNLLIEKALCTSLRYHPELLEKCRALGEKTIVMTLLPMDISITIIFSHGEPHCFYGADPERLQQPDCHLSATPQALIAMIVQDDKTGLILTGDPMLVVLLQQCLSYTDWDWEKCIADSLGDTLGQALTYPVTTLLRKSQEKIQTIHQHKKMQIADYLQETTDALPLPAEVSIFNQDVDDLRLRVDRLEARIKQYES